MTRQSISFTKPNDEWLKEQLNNQEYSSKSELVNDLIRQARQQQVQIDWIRAKLDKSERNGFTNDTKEQILNQSKSSIKTPSPKPAPANLHPCFPSLTK